MVIYDYRNKDGLTTQVRSRMTTIEQRTTQNPKNLNIRGDLTLKRYS